VSTLESLEVRFAKEHGEGGESYIIVYGHDDELQVSLVDCIEVGPFPDWEALSRRVMRHVITTGRTAL